MDILKQADLEELMQAEQDWCVSIYMPTHKAGQETQQDPVRLRNMARQAQEKLREHGLRRPEVEDLMQPVEDLLTGQPDFWQNQGEGLAIFVSEGFFKTLRLSLKFDELVVVSRTFHIKPLLPLLHKDGKFYILAVSMNKIRLLEGTRHTVQEVKLDGVPTSMEEALHMDDPEEFTGFHTGTSDRHGSRERRAMFYGHGGKEDEDKTNLLRYFQYVDAALNDVLAENIPMVLAGVEYLQPIYHEANTYQNLLEEGLPGNPDDLPEKDLQASAWELVEPIFAKAQKKDLERFEQFHGQQNGLASTDLEAIVKAAFFGQVETLFVPVDVQKWGRYDAENNQVILDAENSLENQDLLDYAAIQTIVNSGQVYALQPEEMPGDSEVAAVLRYAVPPP